MFSKYHIILLIISLYGFSSLASSVTLGWVKPDNSTELVEVPNDVLNVQTTPAPVKIPILYTSGSPEPATNSRASLEITNLPDSWNKNNKSLIVLETAHPEKYSEKSLLNEPSSVKLLFVDSLMKNNDSTTSQEPASATMKISNKQRHDTKDTDSSTTTKEPSLGLSLLENDLDPMEETKYFNEDVQAAMSKLKLDKTSGDNGNSTVTTTTITQDDTNTTARPDTTMSSEKKSIKIEQDFESTTTTSTTTTSAPKVSSVKSSKTTPLPTTTAKPEHSKPDESVKVVMSTEDKSNKTEPNLKSHSNKTKTTTSSPVLVELVTMSTTTTTTKATTTAKPTTTSMPSFDDTTDFKASLEKKLKEDREKMLKWLKRNQDELDALAAMRSLQAQRQKTIAQHDHSDERVHMLEHNRQMSIDPIGHMIKHQQYEILRRRQMGF